MVRWWWCVESSDRPRTCTPIVNALCPLNKCLVRLELYLPGTRNALKGYCWKFSPLVGMVRSWRVKSSDQPRTCTPIVNALCPLNKCLVQLELDLPGTRNALKGYC